jgi:AcrR family transcriptional regulator
VAIEYVRKPKKKRKAGQRAGMTPGIIAAKAVNVFRWDGPDEFSIRAVARRLKVGPTTIHAHFKGGIAELRRAVARRLLEAWVPAYQPNQSPEAYLARVFKAASMSFRQHPHVGRLVIAELSDDPCLSLIATERLSATLRSLAPAVNPGWALDLLVGRLAAFVLMETGAWARDNEAAKARFAAALKGAPDADHPTLKPAAQALVEGLSLRADETKLAERSEAAAAAFIAELLKSPASH